MRSALNKRLTDATRTLQVFDHPGWEDVRQELQRAIDEHEARLHNPNVDGAMRERACWSLVVYKRLLGLPQHFEAVKKDAQSKLMVLDRSKTPKEVDESILMFTR